MPDKLRGWGSAQDKDDLKNAVEHVSKYREQVNRPVFLGEFGVYDTIPHADRMRWIKHVRKEMEATDIPWCLWAYANTFPVYDADKKKWDKDTLKALGLK